MQHLTSDTLSCVPHREINLNFIVWAVPRLLKMTPDAQACYFRSTSSHFFVLYLPTSTWLSALLIFIVPLLGRSFFDVPLPSPAAKAVEAAAEARKQRQGDDDHDEDEPPRKKAGAVAVPADAEQRAVVVILAPT